jgi:hypothetical protein
MARPLPWLPITSKFKGGQGVKIDILNMLTVLCGFLHPERKRQTEDEFLPKKSNKDLGRQEFEKFIYW